MPKRYFSEEEVEELIDGPNVVFQDSHGSGRWSEYMETVVSIDDKFYRINWQSGLTEYQENDYYAGEYDEVFEVKNLYVKEKTDYFTEEAIKKKNVSTVSDDIDSLKVVADTDAVNKCFDTNTQKKVEEALNLLSELDVLDDVQDFSAYRKAAMHYLQNIQKYAQDNKS